MTRIQPLAAAVVAALALPAVGPAYGLDFGAKVEHLLNARSHRLFGVGQPLAEPAGEDDYVSRETAMAGERVKLAKGLKAEFVARNVAQDADMIAFWPSDTHYTHLVLCIEQGHGGATSGSNEGLNPSVQRVNVTPGADYGQVETLLHGMDRCDGIRTTSWGTVLVTEETDDGGAYEIIDPLNTTGHWIADRATGDIRAALDSENVSTKVVKRPALPTMAWEGLTVLPNGVVIAGDELRPGSDDKLDSDGGAIYKFIPADPHEGGTIQGLEQSPLAGGTVYAAQMSCVEPGDENFPQYGQGCEVGTGAWVLVNPLNARADADARGATGYYRPEDLHRDPTYTGEGVRFCWTNTGNADAANYAEVMCAVDPTPLPEAATVTEAATVINDPRTGFTYLSAADDTGAPQYATLTANRFVEGDPHFNAFDNLDFQPKTGRLYVVEDDTHGEIFGCLPDGEDRDIKTDGCVAILSVIDPEAEPTGFIFDATGQTAYLSIQHGETPAALADPNSNPVDGKTDDLLKITGFKLKPILEGGSDQ